MGKYLLNRANTFLARPGVFLGLGWLVAFSPIDGQAAAPTATACPIPISHDSKSALPTVFPKVENHLLVTWDTLAGFSYEAPAADNGNQSKLRRKKKKSRLPDSVQKLNGAQVAIVGFMIPLETDSRENKAYSFILVMSRAFCCYGAVPKMNEWMSVQMEKGKEADCDVDIPVTVFGTLEVGEGMAKDRGFSLYRMVADKVSFKKQNWEFK